MELPNRIEEAVLRVATRSSTRREEENPGRSRRKKNRRKNLRSREEPEPDPSDSEQTEEPGETQPIETSENGVEARGIPEDISEEVRQDLTRSGVRTPHPRVRFDDNPVFIEATQKVDDYDIIQDIKDQKANVTIGQLLHDNANYQKLIREAWTKRRKRRFKLPSVAVNFSQIEDHGAPELTVEIDGCSIPKVPVDGGSGVNLMLEDTAFDLGYTSFEITDQVLRMADQSRVIPVGKLSQVPTLIGEVTYLLNYVIIRVSAGRPFPMLLGRPWLYSAEVVVDWGAKEFAFGKPRIRIPWKTEEYLGEISETDGYTTDWSDPDEGKFCA